MQPVQFTYLRINQRFGKLFIICNDMETKSYQNVQLYPNLKQGKFYFYI